MADDIRDLSSAFCFTVYCALLLYLNLPPPEQREDEQPKRFIGQVPL